MKEPPSPSLDQFDLDEHFAKESLRLAQLTNKCSNGEDDLEYYIAESGDILGITKELPFGERSAKHILFHIFKQVVEFKKQDGYKAGYNDPQGPTNAYEMNDSNSQFSVEAEAVTIVQAVHLSHVDLAPMKGDAGRSHLKVCRFTSMRFCVCVFV